MTDEIPFAFDADFYRSMYSDLADMTAAEAAEHFYRYGINEGRQGSPEGCRSLFVDRLNTLGSVLEIGPFCSPVMRGDHVRYLDMLDAGQLRVRAAEIGMDSAGCPDRIHYVGGMADVEEIFDGVISCHSIEHQPDLIRHFNDVERVLHPKGGRYHLIIPDKRYCFDHFIPESTVAEVIQAYEERRKTHTLRSVIEHRALTTHNNSVAHWQGNHGEDYTSDQGRRILEAIDLYRTTSNYLDVHAWCFTPTNFWRITSALYAAGLTPLRPVEIHSTVRNGLEFFAVLERD